MASRPCNAGSSSSWIARGQKVTAGGIKAGIEADGLVMSSVSASFLMLRAKVCPDPKSDGLPRRDTGP